MAELQKNQLHTLTMDGYTAEGLGVARIEGRVVFVHGGVRGEVCSVRILKVLKNMAFGRVEEIFQPSPARREPDCPHYPACGGCAFRHISYEEELEAKRRRVEDALRRIGGAELPVSVIHGAENTLRYRNKVQFPVSEGAVGYYRGRTHQVVDVADCLLQPELVSVCRAAVKGWMERFHIPAYDERAGRGLVRHLFVRTNFAGEALCCMAVNGRKLPHEGELTETLRRATPSLAGVALSVNTKRTNVILGDAYRTLWGRDWLEEELCGHVFRLSVPSFFQVNREQTQVLYRRALDFAALTGGETVVELYCGIGTISLTMAEQARQVIGVEVVPQAVADAQENARRGGLGDKTRFECGDAAALAAQLEGEGVRPDVVVVDPPRKGLAPEAAQAIARMAPARVVYVSCDPATLARDVKRFAPLGYAPVRAEAVDLFPRTAHVESVLLLVPCGAAG